MRITTLPPLGGELEWHRRSIFAVMKWRPDRKRVGDGANFLVTFLVGDACRAGSSDTKLVSESTSLHFRQILPSMIDLRDRKKI